MKYALLFLLPLWFGEATRLRPSSGKKFYYFCQSTPKTISGNSAKPLFLYTAIREVVCEETFFANKAAEWGTLVNNQCKNEGGCNSDLNYYLSLKDATVEFEKIDRHRADSSQYIYRRIDFK